MDVFATKDGNVYKVSLKNFIAVTNNMEKRLEDKVALFDKFIDCVANNKNEWPEDE